jgi:hypothetical protein
MVTASPFFRDKETEDAVNALLILRTTPLTTTRGRDIHMAENDDDETIDAGSLSELNEENRNQGAPESEGSVYAGDEDFEIGTIRTEDVGKPVGKLV